MTSTDYTLPSVIGDFISVQFNWCFFHNKEEVLINMMVDPRQWDNNELSLKVTLLCTLLGKFINKPRVR